MAGTTSGKRGEVLASPWGPAIASRRIDLDGIECHFLEAGQGPPVILVHGIAGSSDDWAGVIPALATRWRVIAPDAPGHGWTPVGHAGQDHGLGAYVDFLRRVIAWAGGGPVPLVAMSGGGAPALALVTAMPGLVGPLALVSAAGLGREVAWSYRAAAFAGPVVCLALKLATPASAGVFARRLCVHPDRIPDGWAKRRAATWRRPGVIDTFVATARASMTIRGQRHDFVRHLPEITHPVLLLWGRNDPILPVAHALRAARLLPRATLHVIDRCGHVPPWEYPAEVASQLDAFLDTHRDWRPDVRGNDDPGD